MSEPSENEKILQELKKLNDHRFVRAHDRWGLLIVFNLVRGLAFGLGSVLGATVLVSILVYSLRQIDFLPIIGSYVQQILDMLPEN